jgi:hypothetical protein
VSPSARGPSGSTQTSKQGEGDSEIRIQEAKALPVPFRFKVPLSTVQPNRPLVHAQHGPGGELFVP